MRILADLGSAVLGDPKIIQVEKTPPLNERVPINGKFVIPMVGGTDIQVDSASYILPVDGGDVYSQLYALLLKQYPMFTQIHFNPLLTASNRAEFDIISSSEPIRAQLGDVPLTTAILPDNTSVGLTRNGHLLTNTIDITTATGGLGADTFMVYWKIYGIETDPDVVSSYGKLSGTNQPAIRYIKEVVQEPAGLGVSLSNDNGATYLPAGRLQPVSFLNPDVSLRLRFLNTGSDKIYLATYAIMF